MQGRRNESSNGKTVSERDGQNVVPGGFDHAYADKDQCERSNKFCKQRAKLCHAWDAIRLSRHCPPTWIANNACVSSAAGRLIGLRPALPDYGAAGMGAATAT